MGKKMSLIKNSSYNLSAKKTTNLVEVKKSQVAFLASTILISYACQALTFDELQGLTYLQVKGSGLANTCPVIEGGSSNLRELSVGDYTFDKFCMEPTSFKVKDEGSIKGSEPEFV